MNIFPRKFSGTWEERLAIIKNNQMKMFCVLVWSNNNHQNTTI